jgi:hypothetical protein
MTFPSSGAKERPSEEARQLQADQRTNGAADCSIAFFDHLPEADRQQIRDVVAALLAAKQTMTLDGATEPSLFEAAEALGIGERLVIRRQGRPPQVVGTQRC